MAPKKFSALALFCAVVNALTAFTVNGEDPERMGYRRIHENDETVVALLVQRIIRGLETGDPYLYLNFIAEDYQEGTPEASGIAYSLNKNARGNSSGQNTFTQTAFLKILKNTNPGNEHTVLLQMKGLSQHAEGITGIIETTDETGARSTMNLYFAKEGEHWKLVKADGLSLLAQRLAKQSNRRLAKSASEAKGFSLLTPLLDSESAGSTFIFKDLAPEHGLRTLSRRVTAERLQRQLFRLPSASALFAKMQQFNTTPYFQATYVQLVTDPAWNRIVYGDYQKWIKAYDGAESGRTLNRPHGIAVDPQGVVYVADTGNGRVLMLKLSGPVHDLKLSYVGTMGEGELSQPTDLAWDDRGTIFETADDLIWLIDRGSNELVAYRTSLINPERVLTYTSDDFVDLSVVASGRFDGRSDGNIYVADNGTRRIHRLYFDGHSIAPVGFYQCEPETVPASLATDHWGHVYLSDESNRQILKFTSALEPLASLKPDDANFQPMRFHPLFGSVVTADSQPPTWSGYDQAFLMEKWTDNSGARRYELGIDFQIEDLRLAEDLSELNLAGKLTDAGHLKLEVVSVKSNEALSLLIDTWRQAGGVQLRWDRRMPNGQMVAAGYYKLRHLLRSTYEKPPIMEESAAFYLPFYYYEDCGAPANFDAHLVRGVRVTTYGTEAERTIVTDAQEVIYRFSGLNPKVAYEVQASYFSGQSNVEQILYAEENPLHSPLAVGQAIVKTDWLAIPAPTVADGRLELHFVKSGGTGKVSVAEIWLREANYNPNDPPNLEQPEAPLPKEFVLQQNYPNPFWSEATSRSAGNPSTTITFSIPAAYHGPVTLRIFNMLGETVRVLIDGELAPGHYNEVWDGLDHSGRRLASGLYLYQLRAGNFSTTRKLVLMR
jgi:sugar lactone lactonase YvrE